MNSDTHMGIIAPGDRRGKSNPGAGTGENGPVMPRIGELGGRVEVLLHGYSNWLTIAATNTRMKTRIIPPRTAE